MKQILSLALFLFLFSCSSDELAGLDSEIDVEKTSVLDRNLSDCSETAETRAVNSLATIVAENTPQKGVYKFTITTQYPVESAVALFRVHYKIVKSNGGMESKYAIFTLLRGETTDEVYVDHSADGILALMLEPAHKNKVNLVPRSNLERIRSTIMSLNCCLLDGYHSAGSRNLFL